MPFLTLVPTQSGPGLGGGHLLHHQVPQVPMACLLYVSGVVHSVIMSRLAFWRDQSQDLASWQVAQSLERNPCWQLCLVMRDE